MGNAKKVCIIGHFGFDKEMLNGQTVKTKTVTAELERQLGENQVFKIDTHGGLCVLPSVVMQVYKGFQQCENIIIFPAQNGIRVFAPLCAALNRHFHRKLHYVVIGGWLNDFLKEHSKLKKTLQRFTGIYVETSTMKQALQMNGFANVVVMPNFKNIRVLSEGELVYSEGKPYRLCTFSRVTPQKGIEDACKAVAAVNDRAGRTVFALDIYGQIDDAEKEWFASLKNAFPAYTRYMGTVPYDRSVEVLKDYYALLFPTRFYTEGIPGTILDAYAAGVPVISSRWESFSDVVDENAVGIGYTFADTQDLIRVLTDIAKSPEVLNEMKPACIKKASCFTQEAVIEILLNSL